MTAADVIRVLDGLDAAGVEWWVEGGWGVDALVGRQTRAHRDLDLAVGAAAIARVERALAEYHRVDTGEWPRFLVLEDAAGHRVDLAVAGAGALARDDPATRAAGRIGGREVRCATAGHQLAHARGRDAATLRSRIQDP